MEPLTHNYRYHEIYTSKIAVGHKPGVIINDTEAVLDWVRTVHKLTRGVKQVLYLVGWQYDGHDSKYPAMFEVNHRLKRPGDKNARESVLWLMNEAFNYNCAISTHINICDAYENSPLWDEYVKKDLFVREADGSLQKGGIWDGEQSYRVSKALEFAQGYTQKRIDQFLELLPIERAGTVHIDAFFPKPSPFHGVTWDDEVKAIQGIIKYWNSKGVDVTGELFIHDYAGYMPWVLHLNLDEASRLKYHASEICGGGPGWNVRHCKNAEEVPWVGYYTSPEAGCLYEEAWGHCYGGGHGQEDRAARFIDSYCTRTLPWMYMNQREITRHIHTRDSYEVHFSGDLLSRVRKSDRYYTLTEGDRVLVDGTDAFVPAIYRDHEIFAFSLSGGEREWKLPEDWKTAKVSVTQLYPLGGGQLKDLPVKDGWVKLALEPNQAACISPA